MLLTPSKNISPCADASAITVEPFEEMSEYKGFYIDNASLRMINSKG